MRKDPHVRICGGLGSATTLVYPTVSRCDGWCAPVPFCGRSAASSDRRWRGGPLGQRCELFEFRGRPGQVLYSGIKANVHTEPPVGTCPAA